MQTKKSIMHDYFVTIGRRGGSKTSPAKRQAAINAANIRWKNHVKKEKRKWKD